MRDRISYLRERLRERLEARTRPGIWKFIIDQVGQFAFAGFSGTYEALFVDHYTA